MIRRRRTVIVQYTVGIIFYPLYPIYILIIMYLLYYYSIIWILYMYVSSSNEFIYHFYRN